MILRTFLPVGQGAFYCEKLFDASNKCVLNIVYDCGSSTDIHFVQGAILSAFEKDETIDAVFLSHLDNDHINGLPDLLSHCRVKKIYFPLITDEHLVLTKVEQQIKNPTDPNNFSSAFLENPFGALREHAPDSEAVLISVASNEDSENRQYGDNIRSIFSGTDVFSDIASSGKSTAGISWEYVPFNFRQTERVTKLLQALEDEFHRPISATEVEGIWKSKPSKRYLIKNAYKKVPGGLNANSMTVFSGERFGCLYQTLSHTCCYCFPCTGKFFCPPKPSGCLYTGDYDASKLNSWNQLKTAYKKYWDSIGCVQIPHHGSKHNFNSNFLYSDAFFVISAGCLNRYHHPHASVIKQIFLSHKHLSLVNESSCAVTFEIC